jgi:holo-[acyl-carrier protein] synthase
MIIGVGIDVVQISRITEDVAHKILSVEELEMYKSFSSFKRQREFLAGRFCVKEAMKKALPAFEGFHSMTELVVLNDEAGKPYLKTPVFNDKICMISISHELEYAVGLCVVEKTII